VVGRKVIEAETPVSSPAIVVALPVKVFNSTPVR
jgi:hypothetical protein